MAQQTGQAGTTSGTSSTSDRQRLSIWLWIALAGAVLQLSGLASNFYRVTRQGETENRDGWQGIPHTADLIFFSALVAIVFFFLVASNRSPVRGRNVGLWIGIVGLLAFLQLGYRMLAPPFAFNITGDQTLLNLVSGDCQFYCSPGAAAKANAELLTGIWFSFVGCVLVAVAGLAHTVSGAARVSPARPWIAAEQPGRNPWLPIAAVAAVAAFVLGYTVLPFYSTTRQGQVILWSGWLPTPHTSSLILLLAAVTVGLAVVAGRGRSPLGPAMLGGTVAIIGFIISSRILLRILQPPFGSSAEIEPAAYAALGAGVLVLLAGLAQLAAHGSGRSAARDTVAESAPS